jgi:lauroyl/myristoyl acyltransferase
MWTYYFRDLPLWACGLRRDRVAARLLKRSKPEAGAIRQGFTTLCNYTGTAITESEMENVIEKSLWVKIVAESDIYLPIKMSTSTVDRYVAINGLDHISPFLKGSRPIVLLSAHTGSFNVSAIALLKLGIPVYVIARKFAFVRSLHPAKQLFMWLHHRLITMRFPVRYIYTDFAGKIDRAIMPAMEGGNIILALIDIPRFMFPHKRIPVSMFGRTSSLPSGFILWALRKRAIFLTAWSMVEMLPGARHCRSLIIQEAIPDGADVNVISQVYADRLSELVAREPWQWMELPIINRYDESGHISGQER